MVTPSGFSSDEPDPKWWIRFIKDILTRSASKYLLRRCFRYVFGFRGPNTSSQGVWKPRVNEGFLKYQSIHEDLGFWKSWDSMLKGGGSNRFPNRVKQTAFSQWGKMDDFFKQWTSLGTMSGFLTVCKRSQLQNILLQKQTCSSTKGSLFFLLPTRLFGSPQVQ